MVNNVLRVWDSDRMLKDYLQSLDIKQLVVHNKNSLTANIGENLGIF